MEEVETSDLSSREDNRWGKSVGALVEWPSPRAGSLAEKAYHEDVVRGEEVWADYEVSRQVIRQGFSTCGLQSIFICGPRGMLEMLFCLYP